MPSLDISNAAVRGQFSALVRNGWMMFAVVAVALVQRVVMDLVGDVSWLITLCEKILLGQTPYVDFFETNPPASIYLYLVPVAFAKPIGVTPEFAVGLFVFVAAAISLWFSARILREAKVEHLGNLWLLATLFAALLLLLPGRVFAQREHIALIAFLPFLAVMLARTQGKPLQLHWVLIAGLAAGFVSIIKPHFAGAVAVTAFAAAILAKSWRPIFALENWIATILLAIYGAIVVRFFPAFVDDLFPVIMAVYVPLKANWLDLFTLGSGPLWLGAMLVALMILGRDGLKSPYLILFAASIGFSLSFFLQRKGWAYHSYPMIALVFAGLIAAYLARWPLNARGNRSELLLRVVSGAFIIVIVGMTFHWFSFLRDTRKHVEPIQRVYSNPKVMGFTDGTDTGFPLTRKVNGEWVGRNCCLWTAAGAMVVQRKGVSPEEMPKLEAYIERERRGILEDLTKHKPDLLIFEHIRFDWLGWAKEDPRIARELEHYVEFVNINDILVLRRK